MEKNFRLMLISLLVIGSMAFSACVPVSPEPPRDSSVEEDSGAIVDHREPPVSIRLFSPAAGHELALMEAAARRYVEMHPNVAITIQSVKYNPATDSISDLLAVYLEHLGTRSAEVDLYQINVTWPGHLAEHLVDLYEYGAAEHVGNHFPVIIDNNTVDGRLVGIPWVAYTSLLYYRTDLLEKYGYHEPPATWAELEKMATAIQAGERAAGNPDFWGFVWQGGAYDGLTGVALEWIYSNGGGTIISSDRTITINNPRAIEAIERAARWVGTISPPGVTGFRAEDARKVWQAGNAAFMRNWPYAYFLGSRQDSQVAGLFDVSLLPAGASGHGAATLGGWQIAVSRYSPNPKVAADVAFHMGNFVDIGRMSLRPIEDTFIDPSDCCIYLWFDPDSMFLDPDDSFLDPDDSFLDPDDSFLDPDDSFRHAVARPSTATAANYDGVSSLFSRAVHAALTGTIDARSTARLIELELVRLTGFPPAKR